MGTGRERHEVDVNGREDETRDEREYQQEHEETI
jgi:hypothetical protein